MTNIHAALIEHVQEQNKNRTKWEGDFIGIKVMYAKPRCPSDEDALAVAGAADVLSSGAKFGTFMAALIAHKAEDISGQKIFNLKRDLPILKEVDEETIAQIYLGLFSGQGPETEDEFEARVGN